MCLYYSSSNFDEVVEAPDYGNYVFPNFPNLNSLKPQVTVRTHVVPWQIFRNFDLPFKGVASIGEAGR